MHLFQFLHQSFLHQDDTAIVIGQDFFHQFIAEKSGLIMFKPGCSLINASIRNLSIVFILFTFNNVIFAADEAENNESKRLYEAACTQCHGLDRVQNESMTLKQWHAIVERMIDEGATLSTDEQDILIEYLAKTYP